MNSSLDVIVKELSMANKIALFPHVRADGDAIGSCVALSTGLKKMGKDCFIVMDEGVSASFSFLEPDVFRSDFIISSEKSDNQKGSETIEETLNSDYFFDETQDNERIKEIDLSVCVDCGALDRFPGNNDIFLSAAKNMCIDHHSTSDFFCDYNYVYPEVAATGELIYEILNGLGVPIDAKIAEAIYTSIVTDTGNFKYSNTTSNTHRIVSELYKTEINTSKINTEIFESKSFLSIKILGKAFANLKYICNNKCVLCYLTQEMIESAGATISDSEGIVDAIRSIKGIEIAVFLKEIAKNEFKVSLRSKGSADLTIVAQKYNGGGHAKAAGCTIYDNVENAVIIIEEELNNLLCQ